MRARDGIGDNPRDGLTLIPGLVGSIAYRPNGSTEAIAYGNGVKTAFAYDPDRAWLLKVTHKRPSGATLREVAYARDDAGRVIRATTAGQPDTWSYGYDALDRLVSASNVGAGAPAGESRTFAYDTAGNLTNQSTLGTYVYPTAGGAHPHAPNRIEDGSGQPVKSYGYDGNGNVTLIRQYAGGVEVASGKRLIAYDGENRPVTVSRGGVTVTSVYGPEGERIAKTVTEPGQPTKTTWYLGSEIEVTASGSWVVSPHPDVKLVLPAGASAGAAPAVCWLHRDQLASVRAETDAAGNLALDQRYLPYGASRPGATVPASACSAEESRGWIGERADPESGLTYLHARWYDAEAGRFLTADWWDPVDAASAAKGNAAGVLGNPVGTNRYAYAGNDPVNKSDRNGHAGIGHNGGPDLDLDELDGDIYQSLQIQEFKILEPWISIDIGGKRMPDPLLAAVGEIIIQQTNRTDTELDKLDRTIRRKTEDPLNAKHFDAARRELAGEIVARKANGQSFDHTKEVQDAMKGLKNDILRLLQILSRNNLTPEQRARADELLGRASNRLDNAEKAIKHNGKKQSESDKKDNHGKYHSGQMIIR